MHSFLLIGQSNMAGRGYINEARSIDMSCIYILKNGRWQKMFRPINPDRSFSGVSLAESFAERYAARYDVDVGLICCADGGTTIEQWQPGGLLYDHAVMNARLAQRSSTLMGVLWHQGESDCPNERCLVYRYRLTELMENLRKDLDQKDVPILLGGLGDFLAKYPIPSWELKNYPLINDALKTVSSTLDMTGYVSAEGLRSNPDYLHFNAESLYEFGLRYFTVYERLVGDQKTAPAQQIDAVLERSQMELL